MLLHGATNVIFRYFPRDGYVFHPDNDFDILKTIAYWLVALTLLIITRGRLGADQQTLQKSV